MTTARVQVPETIDSRTVRVLRADLAAAFADTATRVIELAGSARCFCRGMSLGSALHASGVELDAAEFAGCLSDLRLGPKPVIAVVEGPATGGGVGLAAAADLVIASPAASFGLTELLFGLLPAIILPYLLERLSPATVRLWGLSAQSWTAQEAHAAGLVDAVAEDEACDTVLHTWARRLARAEPSATSLWKRHTALSVPFDRDGGAAITAAHLSDPKVRERIRRYVEEEQLPWMEAHDPQPSRGVRH